jgi:hypothetical protein
VDILFAACSTGGIESYEDGQPGSCSTSGVHSENMVISLPGPTDSVQPVKS